MTGALEPGETLEQAALRELDEETRLSPVGLFPVKYQYTFTPKGRRRAKDPGPLPITEHVFLAILSAKLDPTIDPAEHDAWDWFTFPDAIRWLRWPENVEALKRCEALVNETSQDHDSP